MFLGLNPIPIIQNALDHEMCGAFQIQISSFVVGIRFQHLLKADRGFGKFPGIIEVQSLLKVGYNPEFQDNHVLWSTVIDFKEQVRSLV